MERFHAWLEALSSQVLPESRLGKAVHYTLGQWAKLMTFLSHGVVPIDNNRCENSIRPFVLGRKGWLFSDTVRVPSRARISTPLVETCKANGVEPHAYLTFLFERLPHLNTAEDYEQMLPWNLKASAP